ncbi:MAG: RpoL/Rpb11 RNA polymerase subunit family protein [Candidatus Hydrothermarchaeales archaeon]
MEIEVLEEGSEGFEIKVLGEDHTFLNLLNTFLSKNKKVEYSAYKIDHPLIGEPKLFFRLKDASEFEDIPVTKVKGVGPKTAEQLMSAGIKTIDQLLLSTPEKLVEKTGIPEKLRARYIDEARKMVPEDRFGYRAVLKETLSEISTTFGKIKKEFKEAR